ncbi:hypothetical protein RHMOL_Rhmol02G0164100 [Rhododendron molle]|uniref:Uncharacterized protein n=1 Tax=Rhododendron molle TaxID=49168 RepID=A0ACC0PTW5_RHOML|nr:hypothetical protein RHMOL_Rhmol02G0164100 [Rhododendron molle]
MPAKLTDRHKEFEFRSNAHKIVQKSWKIDLATDRRSVGQGIEEVLTAKTSQLKLVCQRDLSSQLKMRTSCKMGYFFSPWVNGIHLVQSPMCFLPPLIVVKQFAILPFKGITDGDH